jgi:hypothetical protein
MAFKDYEEIVDKCCDAWNDILKKDTNQWVETNQLFLENYLAILAKEAIAISKPTWKLKIFVVFGSFINV